MRAFALATLLLASGCGAATTATSAAPVVDGSLTEDGRNIAETQCSGCHAIGRADLSPLPAAPPLRTILSRYRADVLEEELIAGIRVAHPMPQFQFNPVGADALIAYLRSIQTPASERAP